MDRAHDGQGGDAIQAHRAMLFFGYAAADTDAFTRRATHGAASTRHAMGRFRHALGGACPIPAAPALGYSGAPTKGRTDQG